MTDVKKSVEIVFTGNTADLKRAQAEAKSFISDVQASATKMNKDSMKGHKAIAGMAKKTRGVKAIREEQTLYKLMKQQTAEAIKRTKAYERMNKQAQRLKGTLRGISSEAKKAGNEMNNMLRFFGLKRGGGGRGGAGGAGGGAATRRPSGPGFMGKMARGLGGLAVGGLMGLGGLIMGLVTSQLSQGYSDRTAYGRAYGGLAGTGGSLASIQRSRRFGVRMGMGPIEMATQALPFARATGVVGGGALRQGLALSRATTLGGGEAAQFMGMLTQSGQGFGGRAGSGGRNQLVKTLALGVHSGLDRARMPEFFGSVTQLVQRQMTQTGGDVDASAVARLLAQFGASGMSGLQGARGGQVMLALDQAIRRPGGGEAGQALMLQAMGFGKPGGGASYYEALRKQEHGVFGEGNLQSMFSETRSQYGGGQAQILALRTMTGLTIDQLEQIRKVVDSNMSSEQKQNALVKIQAEAKSIEEQALEEMQEFGDTTRRIAGLQDRSIGIGSEIKKAVEDIQDVINEGIIAMLPLIKTVLETIRDVIVEIRNYVATWLDAQFTPEQQRELANRMDDAIDAGAEEAAKAVADSQERTRALEERRRAPLSTVEALMVAGEGALTSARVLAAGRSGRERIVDSTTEASQARRLTAEYRQQERGSSAVLADARSRSAAAQMQVQLNEGAARLAEDGYTRGERALVGRIDAFIAELRSAQDVEHRQALVDQGRALLDAVDEMNRTGGGTGSPAASRGTTRPTTSGM